MAECRGFDKVAYQLRLQAMRARSGGDNPVVAVGYTAAYALPVHEDTEMKWQGYSRDPRIRRIEMGGDPALARPRPRKREPKGRFWDPQGRAGSKYLENPARAMRRTLGDIIIQGMRRGLTMGQALLMAGMRLLRESQLQVPVDSGNLRASGFCRREDTGTVA